MKKLLMALVVASSLTAAYSSEYIQQQVTSEVYMEQVQYTSQSYNTQQYRPLRPITVHAGRTITVKDHYDVYQPRIVYDKVDSYTVTKTCSTCN